MRIAIFMRSRMSSGSFSTIVFGSLGDRFPQHTVFHLIQGGRGLNSEQTVVCGARLLIEAPPSGRGVRSLMHCKVLEIKQSVAELEALPMSIAHFWLFAAKSPISNHRWFLQRYRQGVRTVIRSRLQ
jgi:hypothetical protein